MSKTKDFFSIDQTYESRYSAYRKQRNDEQKPENAKKTVIRFFLLIRPHAFAMAVVVLAAMGIVLKLERIPINIGLGVCLGMVPLIAYNYGAGNQKRTRQFFSLARITILVFSCVCVALFLLFARPIVAAFISDEETIVQGVPFLQVCSRRGDIPCARILVQEPYAL